MSETPKTPAAKPAEAKAERKRPQEGGSYVREKSGALKLVERTLSQPAKTPAKATDPGAKEQ